MPIITVHARKPRARALLADIPPAVAAVLGCEESEVWIYVIDLDAAETGRNDVPMVIVRAKPRDPELVAAGLRAIATVVADTQGAAIEDVWVQWIDVEPGRVFAGGTVH
jgi:phenylpyruvate tautomerase PptA (4-oxalocrotonate tautomerase family)